MVTQPRTGHAVVRHPQFDSAGIGGGGNNADRQDFVSLKICKRRSISDPRSAVVSLPGLPDDCAG
jgi:hypothetical protein